MAATVLPSLVSYDVRTEPAEPRPLAAVRAETTPDQLSENIIRLLNLVWPVLREQNVRTGHNVVIYHGASQGTLTIEAGVETFTEFTDHGEVKHTSTPSGTVVTTAHYGEYSGLGAAYTAVERWCAGHARQPSGVSWEVYGDWNDDPAQRRTDIYLLLQPT